MRRPFRLFTYFTPWEWGLWLFSVLGILLSFFLLHPAHISLVVCFSLFLLNDVYAFASWLRLEKKQRSET